MTTEPAVRLFENSTRRAGKRRRTSEFDERGAISWADRTRPRVRHTLRVIYGTILLVLAFTAVFPLLWLAKASISTTQDIIRDPLGWWPSGIVRWDNLVEAWDLDMGLYLANTAALSAGSMITSVVVCITGAYVLSVLKPWWAPILWWVLIITVLLPGVIALVPLYLTVLDMPLLDISLLNTWWAVWLPAGASAFMTLLVKRYFDSIPRELMDAARIDGAGPFRVLTLVVIPLSKPIISVVALLSAVQAYKEFLWPLLVLREPTIQPISVMLPRVEQSVDLSVRLAALLLALVVPVVLFLIFQRRFLRVVGMASGLRM